MTHKDIYTKFMIEYDKANVTSSYPSLTEYEVATVLDKAYNALIALKVTGNNIRRVALEGDLKNITDLKDLVVKNKNIVLKDGDSNIKYASLPTDFLYFIGGEMFALNKDKKYEETKDSDNYTTNVTTKEKNRFTLGEGTANRRVIVKLVNHSIAERFLTSMNNLPWIKNPVIYIEDKELFAVYDPLVDYTNNMYLTYIKTPNKFVKPINGDIDDIERYFNISDDTSYDYINKLSYFEYKLENDWSSYDRDLEKNISDKYTFECNDTVAEELISLAVAFALENVESQRLNSKLNMRGLEA